MEIPISNILLLCLIFLLIGGVVMILLQYLLFIKFSNLPDESDEQKQMNAKYTLPLVSAPCIPYICTYIAWYICSTYVYLMWKPLSLQNIKQTARNLNTTRPEVNNYELHPNNVHSSSTLVALNFVMQFLFHEFKNSNRVRKWFYRKLSIELDELITKTTTGKLLDKLTVS